MVENVTGYHGKKIQSKIPLDYYPRMYENELAVNRTRGFVNLNRFKFGRAIKQLSKISHDKHKKTREERDQSRGQQG